MDTDTADMMKTTIAFLVARYKDDKDAARELLGIREGMTEEEEFEAGQRVSKMLCVMTDLAISQIGILGQLVGVNTGKMIRTLGLQMAKMAETEGV